MGPTHFLRNLAISFTIGSRARHRALSSAQGYLVVPKVKRVAQGLNVLPKKYVWAASKLNNKQMCTSFHKPPIAHI